MQPVYYVNYSLLNTYTGTHTNSLCHAMQIRIQAFLKRQIHFQQPSYLFKAFMCVCVCRHIHVHVLIFVLVPWSLRNSRNRKPLLVAQASKQACDWQLLSSQQHESFTPPLSPYAPVWSDGEKAHVTWCFSSGLKSLFNLLDSSYPTLNKHRLVLFFKACGTYLTRSVSPGPCPTMAPAGMIIGPIGIPSRYIHTHRRKPSLIHICTIATCISMYSIFIHTSSHKDWHCLVC